MTTQATSRRVPWVALALSLLSAGVGHLYCGRITKGIPLYFAWGLVPLGIAVAAMVTPSRAALFLLVILPVVAVIALYAYAAVDAWRLARRTGPEYALRDYNRTGLYVILIAVQLVYPIGLMAAVRGMVYEPFLVPASSMSPTIVHGDRILARKLRLPEPLPARGDLVVFRNPGTTGGHVFVKRVVAVAGDLIEIQADRLRINGEPLDRKSVPPTPGDPPDRPNDDRVLYEENAGRRYRVRYADDPTLIASRRNLSLTVPDRHVFVIGDNRDRARDSRHFGPVHVNHVIGQVDYVYWPAGSWSRFGVVR